MPLLRNNLRSIAVVQDLRTLGHTFGFPTSVFPPSYETYVQENNDETERSSVLIARVDQSHSDNSQRNDTKSSARSHAFQLSERQREDGLSVIQSLMKSPTDNEAYDTGNLYPFTWDGLTSWVCPGCLGHLSVAAEKTVINKSNVLRRESYGESRRSPPPEGFLYNDLNDARNSSTQSLTTTAEVIESKSQEEEEDPDIAAQNEMLIQLMKEVEKYKQQVEDLQLENKKLATKQQTLDPSVTNNSNNTSYLHKSSISPLHRTENRESSPNQLSSPPIYANATNGRYPVASPSSDYSGNYEHLGHNRSKSDIPRGTYSNKGNNMGRGNAMPEHMRKVSPSASQTSTYSNGREGGGNGYYGNKGTSRSDYLSPTHSTASSPLNRNEVLSYAYQHRHSRINSTYISPASSVASLPPGVSDRQMENDMNSLSRHNYQYSEKIYPTSIKTHSRNSSGVEFNQDNIKRPQYFSDSRELMNNNNTNRNHIRTSAAGSSSSLSDAGQAARRTQNRESSSSSNSERMSNEFGVSARRSQASVGSNVSQTFREVTPATSHTPQRRPPAKPAHVSEAYVTRTSKESISSNSSHSHSRDGEGLPQQATELPQSRGATPSQFQSASYPSAESSKRTDTRQDRDFHASMQERQTTPKSNLNHTPNVINSALDNRIMRGAVEHRPALKGYVTPDRTSGGQSVSSQFQGNTTCSKWIRSFFC